MGCYLKENDRFWKNEFDNWANISKNDRFWKIKFENRANISKKNYSFWNLKFEKWTVIKRNGRLRQIKFENCNINTNQPYHFNHRTGLCNCNTLKIKYFQNLQKTYTTNIIHNNTNLGAGSQNPYVSICISYIIFYIHLSLHNWAYVYRFIDFGFVVLSCCLQPLHNNIRFPTTGNVYIYQNSQHKQYCLETETWIMISHFNKQLNMLKTQV
jgi:hypothetical protein